MALQQQADAQATVKDFSDFTDHAASAIHRSFDLLARLRAATENAKWKVHDLAAEYSSLGGSGRVQPPQSSSSSTSTLKRGPHQSDGRPDVLPTPENSQMTASSLGSSSSTLGLCLQPRSRPAGPGLLPLPSTGRTPRQIRRELSEHLDVALMGSSNAAEEAKRISVLVGRLQERIRFVKAGLKQKERAIVGGSESPVAEADHILSPGDDEAMSQPTTIQTGERKKPPGKIAIPTPKKGKNVKSPKESAAAVATPSDSSHKSGFGRLTRKSTIRLSLDREGIRTGVSESTGDADISAFSTPFTSTVPTAISSQSAATIDRSIGGESSQDGAPNGSRRRKRDFPQVKDGPAFHPSGKAPQQGPKESPSDEPLASTRAFQLSSGEQIIRSGENDICGQQTEVRPSENGDTSSNAGAQTPPSKPATRKRRMCSPLKTGTKQSSRLASKPSSGTATQEPTQNVFSPPPRPLPSASPTRKRPRLSSPQPTDASAAPKLVVSDLGEASTAPSDGTHPASTRRSKRLKIAAGQSASPVKPAAAPVPDGCSSTFGAPKARSLTLLSDLSAPIFPQLPASQGDTLLVPNANCDSSDPLSPLSPSYSAGSSVGPSTRSSPVCELDGAAASDDGLDSQTQDEVREPLGGKPGVEGHKSQNSLDLSVRAAPRVSGDNTADEGPRSIRARDSAKRAAVAPALPPARPSPLKRLATTSSDESADSGSPPTSTGDPILADEPGFADEVLTVRPSSSFFSRRRGAVPGSVSILPATAATVASARSSARLSAKEKGRDHEQVLEEKKTTGLSKTNAPGDQKSPLSAPRVNHSDPISVITQALSHSLSSRRRARRPVPGKIISDAEPTSAMLSSVSAPATAPMAASSLRANKISVGRRKSAPGTTKKGKQEPAPLASISNSSSPNKKHAGSIGGGGGTRGKEAAADAQHRASTTNEQKGLVEEPEDEDDETVDENEPTYCLCNQVSWGSMIACENEECEKEWFHLPCVGLTQPPPRRAKWYCPACQVLLGVDERGNASVK